MSQAITPSQLKAELETEKDVLLKACLYALNEIPNRSIPIDLCACCTTE